jgi:hypothetical protein
MLNDPSLLSGTRGVKLTLTTQLALGWTVALAQLAVWKFPVAVMLVMTRLLVPELVMVSVRVEVAPTATLPKRIVALLSVTTCPAAVPTQSVQLASENSIIACEQLLIASVLPDSTA